MKKAATLDLTGAFVKSIIARLDGIVQIIEAVDRRCMSADGSVTKTREEITDDELRAIYKLAGGGR